MINILIVDDEVVAVNALMRRVDWSQYGIVGVHAAQSVLDAIAVLQTHDIQLLLCDIEMPQANGLELFEWVREHFPQIECVFVTCHADFEYIRTALKLGSLDYILKPIDYDELDKVLRKATDRIEKSAAKRAEEMHSAAYRFAKTLDTDVEPPAKTLVAQAVTYIFEHITEAISVQEIATSVHLNSQYLMRLFKKEKGCSIMEYITNAKVEMAAGLLTTTDLSVNRIADSVGYTDYSYFVKVFRRVTGKTPSAFRTSHKNTI